MFVIYNITQEKEKVKRKGRSKEGQGKELLYLDYKNKTYNDQKCPSHLINKSISLLNNHKPCSNGKGVFVGRCSDCGAVFVASMDCKKEICEVCGKEGSSLHRQKMARWIGKMLWAFYKWGYVSYLVITTPQEIRDKFEDHEVLKRFRRYIVRKMKRLGFEAGKVRYHWTGDLTGKRGEFYPHLNFLGVGRGYLSKKEIEEMKADITKWFKAELGVETKRVVLYYQVVKGIAKVWHKVRYITRPTLLMIEDEEKRQEIWDKIVRGFTNDISFGKFGELEREVLENEVLKELLNELEKENVELPGMMATILFFNRCPICFGEVKWKWKNYNFTSDGGLEGVLWFERESGRIEPEEFKIEKDNIFYLGLGFFWVKEEDWLLIDN